LYNTNWEDVKQEAQLSQRDRATAALVSFV